MRSWRRCLDAARIHGDALRSDYTRAAVRLLRREPAGYTALRLLAPEELQPHITAGYAFASYTDDVGDHGTVAERIRRFQSWSNKVVAALDGGSAHHPLLRAFLHTAGERSLPRRWIDAYLTGARVDLDFPGFTTEADYQAYVDQLTWPFLMLTTGLLPRTGGEREFAASCRLLADACQRTDILTDLAADLGQGRLYLPTGDLERFGVERRDLDRGRETAAVRALLSATAETAEETLRRARGFVEDVEHRCRPMAHFIVDLHHQRLARVRAAGCAATRRPVRDDPLACLRLLHRTRWAARAAGSPLTAG